MKMSAIIVVHRVSLADISIGRKSFIGKATDRIHNQPLVDSILLQTTTRSRPRIGGYRDSGDFLVSRQPLLGALIAHCGRLLHPCSRLRRVLRYASAIAVQQADAVPRPPMS